MSLPESVAAEDRQLDREASRASEDLARLRWHWTLDETNAERVSLSEYARAVGRTRPVIGKYAQGYATWASDTGSAGVTTLSEAIERAAMSAEREAATDAVAKARGVTFKTARESRSTEVRRVLDTARERVEQHGGTIEEQAEKTAGWIVRAERTERIQQSERVARLGLRLVELEGRLDAMRRAGEQALKVAREVSWEDDHQELLRAAVSSVRALLNLIDLALSGAPDVDWDAELATLEGGNR